MQKEYIFKLTNEGKKPAEIQQLLQQRFGQEAFHRTTVYKWSAQARIGVDINDKGEQRGNKPDEQLLIRIQQILDDEPFSSTRSIAHTLNENNMIIYRYMTIYLKKVFRLSRWVPHFLDQKQKQNRVEKTKALSDILKKCQHDSFHSIITGDQKWFTLYYGNNGAWIDCGQNPPEMNGDQINIKKVMVTIVWGGFGFYIVDFLPCDESYNSQYHIENILIPLAEIKSEIWKQSDKRKIWLHLDNSKVHNSNLSMKKYDELGFKRAPHPAYSPDVAHSDFYLFGYLEDRLQGKQFNEIGELEEELHEILGTISYDQKKAVFESWIKRCDWVAANKGEYYHK